MTAGYMILANNARRAADRLERDAVPPRICTATMLRQLASAVDDLLADYHTQYDEIERLSRFRGWLARIATASANADYLRELAHMALEGKDPAAFESVRSPSQEQSPQ